MFATRAFLALAVVLIAGATGRTAPPADPWAAYRFLLGEWVGQGGPSGQGTGTFTFALDLQDKVMVRRNRADLPAGAGQPAAAHEDLMVVYSGVGRPSKAIYFDNEGHVIHYTLSISDDQRVLTFVSDPLPLGGPRFRLSYTKEGADAVAIKFELAPPGKPDDFKTYLEGKARRKGR